MKIIPNFKSLVSLGNRNHLIEILASLYRPTRTKLFLIFYLSPFAVLALNGAIVVDINAPTSNSYATTFTPSGTTVYNSIPSNRSGLTLAANGSGTLTNNVTLTPPWYLTGDVTNNNTASISNTVTQDADLGIAITAAPATVVTGQTLTYTITLTNNGPSPLLTSDVVVITDNLPAGYTVTNIIASAGTYTSNNGNWPGLTLAIGQSATITIRGTVTGLADLIHTVSVAAPNGVTDGTTSNNTATSTVTIMAAAPGGVNTNLYFWVKANAGVTGNTNGANVTRWTNQTSTAMTTEASKTSSSSVTYNTSNLNYNPSLVFDGTSGERLSGTFTTPPTNAPVMFSVAKRTSLTTSRSRDFGNLFSQGPTPGAYGLLYRFVPGGGSYAIDGPGVSCSMTADIKDRTHVVRGFYNSANSATSAFTALDGLATAICPASGAATPGGSFEIGARTFGGIPTRIYTGSIGEVVYYNSNTMTAAQTNKVESYLALKYGTTLDNSLGGTTGNYTSASGATIWTASDHSTYHHDVIGIGNDAISALVQKQSHQMDDVTRIYLSTLNTTNADNTGSFSSDGQFVMMGNDVGALSNTGSTEVPGGVTARLTREWKVTNTAFLGTFSVDIKPTSTCGFDNTSQYKLLVDQDGNFSTGATVFGTADGLTFSINGGVISIAGITTAMIPANSTRYFTLASVNDGIAGAPTSAQTIVAGTSPANLSITSIVGSVTKWQFSSDNFVSDVQDIASSVSTTLTSDQMGTLTANRYYRVVSQNGACPVVNSASVLITVTPVTTPTGNANQTFCQIDNAKVASLQATGTNIQWYANSTDGSPLESTTALTSSTTYFATQTLNGSESQSRFAVTVTITATTAPTGRSAQTFARSITQR